MHSIAERRIIPNKEAALVKGVAQDIVQSYKHTIVADPTLSNPALATCISDAASELPDVVQETMRPPETSAGIAVIGGIALNTYGVSDTPPDWRHIVNAMKTTESHRGSVVADVAMLLLARCAGEPFGWTGQQKGRLVNDILPTPGHENEQSGASSTTLLAPHTEDAFHPDRAHLLLLGCLRNPDQVATTVSSIHDTALPRQYRKQLAKAVVPILPDVSYGTQRPPGDMAEPVPTLQVVNGEQTVLRYDPVYTNLAEASPEFRKAYNELGVQLNDASQSLALQAGELLLMDNDVVVHGRVPFTPRYDGTDRWLKRVNIWLPHRQRSSAENAETGFGQHVVAPFLR